MFSLIFYSSLQKPLDAMNHPDFYQLIGKYKFALAMENGRCNDYITEKIWRPLMAGAVPVILGAQTIKVNIIHLLLFLQYVPVQTPE